MKLTEKKIKKRTLQGVVDKLSSKNTIKVRIEQKYPHTKYGKIIMRHKSYLVHVDDNKFQDVKIGDSVIIAESKPISKMKHWRLDSKLS